ncbi:MAG: hypothetical protein E7574_01975 [Ruminococcaceae bacterium]|nr:hypothetical protein [Oscillospiraceae bacterium]
MIWYIVYHLFGAFDKKIETTPAILATKSNSLLLDAYVMRDETLIYAKNKGGVNYLYEDGERVGVGAAVAKIYSGLGAEEASNRILEIDKKINILENSSIAEDATKIDTNVIDNKISELLFIIRDKIEDGDIEYALYKRDELITYMNKRQILTQNISNYNDQITVLKAERNKLSQQLVNFEGDVIVPNAGFFYSSADGYEEVFDVSKISRLTIDEYHKMVDSEPYDLSNSTAVGKIVNSNEWYILSEINTDQVKRFTEGNSYDIKFPYNSDVSVKMRLEKIIKENDDDRVVLVFKTNVMPSGFNYLRKQNIQIIEESNTGYKVPSNAVRVVDGVMGVYVLSGNKVAFKEIEVLVEQDGYFIVKEQPSYVDDKDYKKKLGLYDMIIVSGKSLYDGKIISMSGGDS